MKISILKPQVIHELGSRNNQEDSVFPKLNEETIDDRLFILCDGMGGHENGEVASQLVCDVLSAYIKEHWDEDCFSDDLFQDAIDEVFNKINEYDSDSFKKMGTTLTFLCLHQGGVLMAHIGDSRIYHIRPSEKLILYKSRDHSLAYDLFLAKEISFDELTTYKKNVITRAIMPGMERQSNADITHTTDILAGDYFLICSDGLLEQMTDSELVDLLSAGNTIEEKRELLIEKTKNNKDNHSAILIQISHVEKEEMDSSFVNDESTTRNNAIVLEKSMRDSRETSSSSKAISQKNTILKVILWLIALAILLLTSMMALANRYSSVQSEKVQNYLREADYYNKKAEGYERDAQYYTNKGNEYIRQAEYYTKKKDSSRARTYTSRANNAFEKARLRMKWAHEARQKAQLRLKWARQNT